MVDRKPEVPMNGHLAGLSVDFGYGPDGTVYIDNLSGLYQDMISKMAQQIKDNEFREEDVSVHGEVRKVLDERRIQSAVEAALQLVDRYGEDNFEDGTVFRFKKQFEKNGVAYTYAAVKVLGMWYTTGPRGASYTWEDFVTWLVAGGESVQSVEVWHADDNELVYPNG